VPDRKHLTMNTVKTTGAQAGGSPLAADAELIELIEGNHPVLPGGDLGNERVRDGLGALCMHVDA
jgi:hypothetical protein